MIIGIILYSFYKIDGFYSGITISIGASGMAGVITAALIEVADKNYRKKERKDAFKSLAILLVQYSLNLAYHYCDFSINDAHEEVDCDAPILDVVLEKYRLFSNLRKPGKLSSNVEKIFKELLSDSSFHLINIKRLMDDAISKNDIIHHIDKYLFEFRTISCDIELVYLKNNVDFMSDKIAMIIEDLSKIDFIEHFFTTFNKNEDIIAILYARKQSKLRAAQNNKNG